MHGTANPATPVRLRARPPAAPPTFKAALTHSGDPIGSSLPRHGGDIGQASRLYGIPEGDWLDLSTGINPVPYPADPIAAAALTRLPSPDDLAALLATARRAYAVPSAAGLVALPGTETGIRLLPMLLPADTVAIVSPTYRTHAEAWRVAGHAVTEVPSPVGVPRDAAYVVVVNPNNPDGRSTDATTLVRLAAELASRGGLLVADESFCDLVPEASLAPHLGGTPAVVFRSLGKFYGLAGLRLGFAAGPPALLTRLAALLGDWPVSGPAVALGRAALGDEAWRETTRQRLRSDGERLRRMLAAHRLKPAGGTDLFTLVDDETAAAIHIRLARRGIWTRIFDYNPRWLRIGLPAPDNFGRLERALAAG